MATNEDSGENEFGTMMLGFGIMLAGAALVIFLVVKLVTWLMPHHAAAVAKAPSSPPPAVVQAKAAPPLSPPATPPISAQANLDVMPQEVRTFITAYITGPRQECNAAYEATINRMASGMAALQDARPEDQADVIGGNIVASQPLAKQHIRTCNADMDSVKPGFAQIPRWHHAELQRAIAACDAALLMKSNAGVALLNINDQVRAGRGTDVAISTYLNAVQNSEAVDAKCREMMTPVADAES